MWRTWSTWSLQWDRGSGEVLLGKFVPQALHKFIFSCSQTDRHVLISLNYAALKDFSWDWGQSAGNWRKISCSSSRLNPTLTQTPFLRERILLIQIFQKALDFGVMWDLMMTHQADVHQVKQHSNPGGPVIDQDWFKLKEKSLSWTIWKRWVKSEFFGHVLTDCLPPFWISNSYNSYNMKLSLVGQGWTLQHMQDGTITIFTLLLLSSIAQSRISHISCENPSHVFFSWGEFWVLKGDSVSI